MTLTSHAVAGSILGAMSASSPVAAVILGFASHFILDAIPHWDYSLISANKNETDPMKNTLHITPKFLIDLYKMGIDTLLGLSIAFALFATSPNFVLVGAMLGALAALLPDLLQFLYYLYRREPLVTIQRFHVEFMHARRNLNNRPVIGIGIQLVLVIIMSIIAILYRQMLNL